VDDPTSRALAAGNSVQSLGPWIGCSDRRDPASAVEVRWDWAHSVGWVLVATPPRLRLFPSLLPAPQRLLHPPYARLRPRRRPGARLVAVVGPVPAVLAMTPTGVVPGRFREAAGAGRPVTAIA
jgi:hypothetical protein